MKLTPQQVGALRQFRTLLLESEVAAFLSSSVRSSLAHRTCSPATLAEGPQWIARLFCLGFTNGFNRSLLSAALAFQVHSERTLLELRLGRFTFRTWICRNFFLQPLFNLIEHSFERHVKIIHYVRVIVFARSDRIEFTFHLGGEIDVKNFGKTLHENSIDIAS